jgi:mannose-6-phosphate isomerase
LEIRISAEIPKTEAACAASDIELRIFFLDSDFGNSDFGINAATTQEPRRTKTPAPPNPMSLYPLKFVPRFVEKMWGGRKIETVLGKKLPPGTRIGESWEIYDFPPGVVESSKDWVSSPIANGPLAGRPLHWAVKEYGAELLGNVLPVGPHGQFPLLVKFLDAREDLSVQVHPDQAYADKNPSAHLKTEAWYVLENDSKSRLFKGLAPGTTKENFHLAVKAGTVEKHLAAIPAKAGQCHYLPSGTIHALGAGILVAEVQTPSDTTFRVFDFNRVDPSTGKQRTLHVGQAMQCIDFTGRAEPAQPRSAAPGPFGRTSRLASSPYFTIEKIHPVDAVEKKLPTTDPVIWIMLNGDARIKVDGIKDPIRFTRGETILLPPSMKNPVLKTEGDCEWLEVKFPQATAKA